MKRILVDVLVLALLLLPACGQKVPTWQQQYDLGVRYLSEGHYEEAIIAFTAAIEIDPMRPETYLDLTYAYIGQNDFDAARDILKRGYELTQDSTLKAKLDELDSGTITDYAGNIRKKSTYDADGNLSWYHIYGYDSHNRKSAIASFDAEGNRTGHVDILYDSEDSKLSSYHYRNDTGEVGKITYEYDNSRNLAKELWYDRETGECYYYCIYQYDSSGNCIREDDYSADGEHVQYLLHFYYERSERVDFYYADGTLDYYQIYNYREDGSIIDCCEYNADGILDRRTVYRYDADGNEIGYDEYYGDGKLQRSTVYE